MPTPEASQTWSALVSRLLRAGLCVLGLLLLSRWAPAEEEPKLAGVEVPAPKRSRFVAPEYPEQAKAQGRRGIVILSLLIDTDGRVVSVEVVRSLPPFDEAAVAAARQWEYEVTRVAGKPVRVRLSVPITFALRLPEVIRGPGVPELRAGLAPKRPAGVPDKASATVVSALTVDPSGEVVTIAVEKGDWPWFESVAASLRTWAFVAGPSEGVANYQVEARFLPVRKNEATVELRIERKPGASATSAAESPAPATAAPSAPEPAAAAPEPPSPAPAAATEPADRPTPLAAPPGAPPEPAVAPPVAAAAPVAPKAAPEPQAATAPPAPPPAAQPSALPEPVVPTPSPAAAPSPASSAPSTAVGVSAVRDVTLGAGVPDLASGRRPVFPPLARLGEVSGVVEVRFSVDAGGVTSGIEVSGPDSLQRAARQAVASWSFRRTSTERVFLVAVFEYVGLRASATVRRAAE